MQSKSGNRGAVSRWAAAGLFAVMACTGCPGPVPRPAETSGKPYAGITLKLACSDPTVLKALMIRAQGWAARNGATLEASPLESADVVVVPPASVGAYAAAGDAIAVPEEMQTLEHHGQWIRTLPVYRDELGAWGGVPRAIPLAGDGTLLVLNTARLAEPALQKKYLAKFGRPLPATPATWEDLAEISEACAELELGAAPALDMEDFFRIAACYDRLALADSDLSKRRKGPSMSISLISFTHQADTGVPRLNTPGFEAAAKLYKRLQSAKVSEDSAAIASGKAAWAVLNLAQIGNLPKDARGMVPTHIALAPLPGTRLAYDIAGKEIDLNSRANFIPYFHGGWFGIVRKSCTHSAAAFDLLAELASPARSLELLADPALGFGPYRQEHLERSRESVWQSYGFDAERTQALANALRHNVGIAIRNPVLGLRGPDAAELTAMLQKSLAGPDAIAAAQKLWTAHDAKLPAAKSWRRQAAGLSAQP